MIKVGFKKGQQTHSQSCLEFSVVASWTPTSLTDCWPYCINFQLEVGPYIFLGTALLFYSQPDSSSPAVGSPRAHDCIEPWQLVQSQLLLSSQAWILGKKSSKAPILVRMLWKTLRGSWAWLLIEVTDDAWRAYWRGNLESGRKQALCDGSWFAM